MERVRLSAQTLRGVAHPLRVRLLTLLRDDGPSTATRLAEIVGESSGSTSYHLRQLATYGFVEEAPGKGGGRERWWRAVHDGSTLESHDARANPEESGTYLRAVAASYSDRMDQWVNLAPQLGPEWDESATLSNFRLRLTPAQGTEMLAEMQTIIDRYERDHPDNEYTDGTARVVVQLQVMPFPGTPPPRRS